jgi:hypothetical protein
LKGVAANELEAICCLTGAKATAEPMRAKRVAVCFIMVNFVSKLLLVRAFQHGWKILVGLDKICFNFLVLSVQHKYSNWRLRF